MVEEVTFGGDSILGTADVHMIKALIPLKASSSSGLWPLVMSAIVMRPSGTSISLKALMLCTFEVPVRARVIKLVKYSNVHFSGTPQLPE